MQSEQTVSGFRSLARRTTEYLLFWSASVGLLAYHFAIGVSLERIDVWFSVLFHLSIGSVVVLNSFVWIPMLLARRRPLRYAVAVAATLLAGIWLHQFTFNSLAGWIFPDYFFISYLSYPEIAAYLAAYTLLTTLIQFSRSWFREADMQRELMTLHAHQQEQELQLLQQQVHPHFLFNSLNSIYALVRKRSDHAESAILELSELLRYTIAHAGSRAVPLDQELDYIKSYITLQKLRLESEARVEVDLYPDEQLMARWQIVPLLLINLVENAFKHAAPADDQLVITVQLKLTDDSLRFAVSNTIDDYPSVSVKAGSGPGVAHNDRGESLRGREAVSVSGRTAAGATGRSPGTHQTGAPGLASTPVQSTGTGIMHLRKRLEYYYKDSHKLDIEHRPTCYTVTLEIQGGTS